MELDELKADWNSIAVPTKKTEEMQLMLSENRHPVLKGIRQQLTIEIVGWSAFLLCYYSMFDGEDKPWFVNLLLIAAVLFAIVHNLIGYRFSKYLIKGIDIKTSLENYLLKVKIYAFTSVAARVIFIAGFLLFFSYNISFNETKLYLMIVVLLVCLVQLTLLAILWNGRLRKLKAAVAAFLNN
jgi:hypothetical protein